MGLFLPRENSNFCISPVEISISAYYAHVAKGICYHLQTPNPCAAKWTDGLTVGALFQSVSVCAYVLKQTASLSWWWPIMEKDSGRLGTHTHTQTQTLIHMCIHALIHFFVLHTGSLIRKATGGNCVRDVGCRKQSE